MLSGVVFTCNLETGAPYLKINFDDKSKDKYSYWGVNQKLRYVSAFRDKNIPEIKKFKFLNKLVKQFMKLQKNLIIIN